MKRILESWVVFVALLLLVPPQAGAQALEDCPRYSPEVLDGWKRSSDIRLAAYGHTCRQINIDAYISQQTRDGFSAVDSHYWIETYQNFLRGADAAIAVNRNWNTADAARNLGVINRLQLKYRKLAQNTQPGVASGSYAGREDEETPAQRFGRQMGCQSRIGTACMAQCSADQTCVYSCQGGNAWRCNE